MTRDMISKITLVTILLLNCIIIVAFLLILILYKVFDNSISFLYENNNSSFIESIKLMCDFDLTQSIMINFLPITILITSVFILLSLIFFRKRTYIIFHIQYYYILAICISVCAKVLIDTNSKDLMIFWAGISLLFLAAIVYITGVLLNLFSIFYRKQTFVFKTVDYFYIIIAFIIISSLKYVCLERELNLLSMELNLILFTIISIKIVYLILRKMLL